MLGLDPSIHANGAVQKKRARLIPRFRASLILALLPPLGRRLERMTWGKEAVK